MNWPSWVNTQKHIKRKDRREEDFHIYACLYVYYVSCSNTPCKHYCIRNVVLVVLTMLTSEILSKLAMVRSKPTYKGSPVKWQNIEFWQKIKNGDFSTSKVGTEPDVISIEQISNSFCHILEGIESFVRSCTIGQRTPGKKKNRPITFFLFYRFFFFFPFLKDEQLESCIESSKSFFDSSTFPLLKALPF